MFFIFSVLIMGSRGPSGPGHFLSAAAFCDGRFFNTELVLRPFFFVTSALGKSFSNRKTKISGVDSENQEK